MKKVWEIVSCGENSLAVADFLADGWEPFAVDNGHIYFRRSRMVAVNVSGA